MEQFRLKTVKLRQVICYRMDIVILSHPELGVQQWRRRRTSPKNRKCVVKGVALHKKEERTLRRRTVLTQKEMESLLHKNILQRPALPLELPLHTLLEKVTIIHPSQTKAIPQSSWDRG